MTTTTSLITADELLAMPRGDGKRYELIRGVLVEKMPTGDSDGETVIQTSFAIEMYARSNDFGETRAGEPGYRLDRDPDTVRAPDVAWFAPGRIPEGTQGYPELVPDLVVEVKSPSNSNREMVANAQMWLTYGSQQVWVEDPERTTVTVYRPFLEPIVLTGDAILDGGDLLPGFSILVWQLFRRHRARR